MRVPSSEYIQAAVLLGDERELFDISQIQIEYDKYKTYAKQEICMLYVYNGSEREHRGTDVAGS